MSARVLVAVALASTACGGEDGAHAPDGAPPQADAAGKEDGDDRPEPLATHVLFNDPLGDEAAQAAQRDAIVALIEGAPRGSRIQMAMFYARDATIPQALAAAHARGVEVQVIFDAVTVSDPPFAPLVEALGSDTGAPSWVMTCPAERGCIGTRKLSTISAINHNKFFLFSETRGATHVVVQASANLHQGRDGLRGWNDALVLVGNQGIYDAYTAYFDDLRAAEANDNYYDTGRPAVASDGAKVHFYPRQETSGVSPYGDPSEDTIATVLDHIDCAAGGSVRVSMSIFSRTYLGTMLHELAEEGCDVSVAETFDPAPGGQQAIAMEHMLAGGDGAVKVHYYCGSDPTWIHAKYLAVHGTYYGGVDRKIVWTGSHNWSTNSLRQSDEIVLQVEDDALWQAYVDHHDAILADPIIRAPSVGVAACH